MPPGFLDSLQRRSFLYFWEQTPAHNGLVPDRWPTPSFSSIAAVGFGLSSYLVGAELDQSGVGRRTHPQHVALFLASPQGPQTTGVTGHKGFFYHFLDMQTGRRFQQVELSTIDTGLLLMGILSSQTYFDRSTSQETAIRAYADSIYRRVDWNWFQPFGSQLVALSMGWHPENGGRFLDAKWIGYNEAMILYFLGLGSPTHPLQPETWNAWVVPYQWATYQGQAHVDFVPFSGTNTRTYGSIFGAFKTSTCGAEATITLKIPAGLPWPTGRIALPIPRAGRIMALTSGDLPPAMVRAASIQETPDDGTIAPTAAGGSLPFAPVECTAALKEMHRRYGNKLWGRYGFKDAFNPSFTFTPQTQAAGGWFDLDYLGIDNGPIVLMIENQRSGFLWNLMKRNPYLKTGLQRAGFSGGWLN